MEGLHHISLTLDNLWLIGEDFNVSAYDGERTSHITRDRRNTTFSNLMFNCRLKDTSFSKS